MRIKIYLGIIRRLIYKKQFEAMKLHYKKGRGNRYFYRHIDNANKTEIRYLVQFCRRRLMRYTLTDDSMERSSNYRRHFFMEHHGVFGTGIYLCAYCGKPLTKRHVCVDHIIPVHLAGSSPKYRRMLAVRGINNVNDTRNLAPSCERCNTKKSDKAGLWIMRGYIGRLWLVMLLRNLLLLALGGALLYGFYRLLHEYAVPYVLPPVMDFFGSLGF